MTDSIKTNKIEVLELRNYLLKPDKLNSFKENFNNRFVGPMNELGGYTLGQFHPGNDDNRFVWLRGFRDMEKRLEFLRAFYDKSAIWKKYGPVANSMMINSDNVHLLKPLSGAVDLDFLGINPEVVVVDFYICNSTLSKTIDFFQSSYLPFLQRNNISPTLWVSEMQENDFPRHPVFQNENLLVSITSYKDEEEYRTKRKVAENLDPDLKFKLLELVTSSTQLVLNGFYSDKNHTEKVEIPPVEFDEEGLLKIFASSSSSKHDFDFLNGKHKVLHKKLKERLNNNHDWVEFEGNHNQDLFLNGMANLEQQTMVDFDGNPVEGAAIRLFDPKKRIWSIYWADSKTGKFDPPVHGSFDNGLAHFMTQDHFNGKEILVVFRWDARDKKNPVWSQAFSADNGKTWEWNWYMYFKRID